MLRREVASTNPVLDRDRTVSQPAPTQYRTPPQEPPSPASSSSAPHAAVPPEASPSARCAEACGSAAIRFPRATAGSPTVTLAAGRIVVPSITARPAVPPGSSGSASRARAASSMPEAVRPRSGSAVPA